MRACVRVCVCACVRACIIYQWFECCVHAVLKPSGNESPDLSGDADGVLEMSLTARLDTESREVIQPPHSV